MLKPNCEVKNGNRVRIIMSREDERPRILMPTREWYVLPDNWREFTLRDSLIIDRRQRCKDLDKCTVVFERLMGNEELEKVDLDKKLSEFEGRVIIVDKEPRPKRVTIELQATISKKAVKKVTIKDWKKKVVDLFGEASELKGLKSQPSTTFKNVQSGNGGPFNRDAELWQVGIGHGDILRVVPVEQIGVKYGDEFQLVYACAKPKSRDGLLRIMRRYGIQAEDARMVDEQEHEIV